MRQRIKSILSPFIGDGFATIDCLERSEAERTGIWVDKNAVKDYIDNGHGDEDEDWRGRQKASSILRRGLTSIWQKGSRCLASSSQTPPFSKVKSRIRARDRYENRGGGGEEDIEEEDEHPMRTDEWLVKVTLSPLLLLPGTKIREASLFPQSRLRYVKEGGGTKLRKDSSMHTDNIGKRNQMMKFARNGYVMLMENTDQSNSQNDSHSPSISLNKNDAKRRMTRIGKWKLDSSGIAWDIPVKLPNSASESSASSYAKSEWTILHYHADMHLSKFQQQPRMIRGTITRDRWNEVTIPFTKLVLEKRVFRPVIGTFSAEGVGQDTIDVSYKNRGLGFDTGNADRSSGKPNVKKKF